MATTRKQTPKPSKSSGKKKGIRWGRVFFGTVATAIVAMICALGIYILFIVNGNKILNANLNKLEDVDEASVVYDVNNKEVTTLYRYNRELVDAKDIPEKVKDAFIATEDRRFDQHFGVDFYSLGRAIITDIVHHSAVEGGSTITQQLAKNVFTGAQKTVFRKATEMSIAIAIENNYSKDQIMQFYLNRIYFGNRAWGIKAASKLYFGVSDLNKLEMWQIATLAAMPKAPSVYNPIDNPQKSMERRAVVLQLMKDQGYITEQERAQAVGVAYTPQPAQNQQEYAAFMDTMVKEAEDEYNITEDDLLSNGYKIYTTMDAKAQITAEQTYEQDKLFQKDASDGKKIQSSMIILNNKDGGIVAVIGARGFKSKDMNLATQNPRQPGSSFKPIVVYGPALDTGKYSPYSMLDDVKQSFGSYSPSNYDGVYRGKVSMLDAVTQSINLPAVWLLDQIGLKTGRQFADKLGIKLGNEDNNLAIALGGLYKGVTPLQMATAYTAFANDGEWYKPHSIVKILDSKGQTVVVNKSVKTTAMSAQTAYYMRLMLQNVVNYGTGTSARFDRPAAGKTGTTQLNLPGLERYNRDVWFVGFTPEWTAAVWEGFLVTDEKHYVTVGSGGPSVIFREVMSKSLAGRPVTSFQKPSGVSEPQSAPKAIGDLSAQFVKESNGVKLTWTGLGDNMHYQVYRKDPNAQDFSKLMDAATPELLDMTVHPGESYQYYVVGVNSQNNTASDKSNIASATVPADAGLPPAPNSQSGNTDNNGNGGNSKNAPNGGKPGKNTGDSGTGSSNTGVTGGTGTGKNGTGTGTGSTGGASGTGSTDSGGTGAGGIGSTGGTSGTGSTNTGDTGGTSTGGTVTPQRSPAGTDVKAVKPQQ